jgi:predicted nucleic-acid-binding protein
LRITPDTNVLVRALTRDHAQQSKAAEQVLRRATSIALAVTCLCELVWVLRRAYQCSARDTAQAIRKLIDMPAVVVNRPAVEAGLAMLEVGGDFADGVIAYEGVWLGAERFVSFDRQAVERLRERGIDAISPDLD